MAKSTIDQLIINSPYEEPEYYWKYDRGTRLFTKENGRRKAGYIMATEASRSFDDPGIFIEIPLVNKIRTRVDKWRENGYPGVTGITKRLLEHWHDPEARDYRRFFFCHLEAIETMIWLIESPDSEKAGIDIPSDGAEFRRLCSKMATGTGKTVVMAMLIAWQVINKAAYPKDTRFSKNIFIVAPGLTVKSRLQVLLPGGRDNYYEEFNIIPAGLHEHLRQGKVKVKNWHTLSWETEEKVKRRKSVDKRGVKSNEAYVREVLGDMANANNIIVINDEAHHAWRINVEAVGKYQRIGSDKDSAEEATIWVGGLDRIHKARGILKCFDFSATPFSPSGKKSTEESLYGWIVSDFGLNDAIESGLVKTPRVVIRDNSWRNSEYKSRLYHIYMDPEVKDNINQKAENTVPLPDLINNAYYLLGLDWSETKKLWDKANSRTPPVMISVANITHTAARIKYAFDHKRVDISDLCDPENTLHIDSKVLGEAESKDEAEALTITTDDDEDAPKRTKKQEAELLRLKVDTIGKVGLPGEQIKNVISVGMLSEGWDARTVTHIMGLRAFTSQLLCEQVVGRGLRRTSYEINPETNMFDPEYVNIFGVPFTFLPHEDTGDKPPPPVKSKTEIKVDPEKAHYEIRFPNVIRIDTIYRTMLGIDLSKIKTLSLSFADTITEAQLATTIDGKPNFKQISEMDMKRLVPDNRLQTIIFKSAAEIYDMMKPAWKGNKEYLLSQVISLVEMILDKGIIQIGPPLLNTDENNKRIMYILNMNKIVQHIWQAIGEENKEEIAPIFDINKPIISTGDMRTWYTAKPNEYTQRSHINCCVYDSTWEACEAFELDRSDKVRAWVKNDHIGFEIYYLYNGIVSKYRPDFIIKLSNGGHLILETKGQDTQRDKIKREFLNEWVKAVNQHGGFGKWQWAVSYNPGDMKEILAKSFSF